METHFHRLLDNLPQLRKKVAALESPNPEDDHAIKFAIVGFSYSLPTESWGHDHLKFVNKRRHEVADFGKLWIEFVCLASGYLLGMYEAGQFSDDDCAMFEALLPGFMWLHSDKFTGVEG